MTGSLDVSVARPVLTVENLSTWFPTERGIVHAVDNVSLVLSPGETVGVVGESGSGKSVLARSIMRLTPPTAITRGTVMFGDRSLIDMSASEGRTIWGNDIAMVFQNPMTSLNPVLKVGRQLTEGLKLHLGMSSSAAKARAIELLALVGIPEPEARIATYPHELSGGMRQRVCIAMAIACSPKLLLADEPTTALDVTIQRQILELLGELGARTHMAMMLITHDLGVVARRTDRVIVMYGGRMVETGPTEKLFTEHFHPYTASLLSAIPRLDMPSHSRLQAIPGRPIDVVDPKPMCRFAPRCERAQPQCVSEDPVLTPTDGDPEHSFACFFPIGSAAGEEALARNRAAGQNAAGLDLAHTSEAVGAN